MPAVPQPPRSFKEMPPRAARFCRRRVTEYFVLSSSFSSLRMFLYRFHSSFHFIFISELPRRHSFEGRQVFATDDSRHQPAEDDAGIIFFMPPMSQPPVLMATLLRYAASCQRPCFAAPSCAEELLPLMPRSAATSAAMPVGLPARYAAARRV